MQLRTPNRPFAALALVTLELASDVIGLMAYCLRRNSVRRRAASSWIASRHDYRWALPGGRNHYTVLETIYSRL